MAILYVSQNYHPTHPNKYYLCPQKMSIKKYRKKWAVKDRRNKAPQGKALLTDSLIGLT